MNKAFREDQVLFGDELNGTEMDQEFVSFTLRTTGQAKAIDARRVAQVELLVGDPIHTEWTGYKFENTRIEPRTHQAIIHLVGRFR
jgi:hypothetical protein